MLKLKYIPPFDTYKNLFQHIDKKELYVLLKERKQNLHNLLNTQKTSPKKLLYLIRNTNKVIKNNNLEFDYTARFLKYNDYRKNVWIIVFYDIYDVVAFLGGRKIIAERFSISPLAISKWSRHGIPTRHIADFNLMISDRMDRYNLEFFNYDGKNLSTMKQFTYGHDETNNDTFSEFIAQPSRR